MWQNAHNAYLESRVLSAGPVELVLLLYQTATGALREARRHLAAGDVLERSRSISKASAALLQLTAALDLERGGEIAPRLACLYDYMLRRVTEANFKQIDAPLVEVLGLLTTLSEGWAAIQTPGPPAAADTDAPWTQAPLPADSAASSASQAWSF